MASGTVQKGVGSVKEAAGKATGEKKLQVKLVYSVMAAMRRELSGVTVLEPATLQDVMV